MLEMSVLLKTLEMAALLGVSVYVAQQVRKPDRFAGRLTAMLMNQSHAKLTDWGLSHIPIAKDFIILDVGWRRADYRQIGNDSQPRQSFRS